MAKKALPRLARGADGRTKTIYIDHQTGEIIDPKKLKDYDIVTADAGEYWDPNSAEKDATDATETPSGLNPLASPSPLAKKYVKDGRSIDEMDTPKGTRSTKAVDNYGYINKPKGLGLASALPGPAGMIGKGVNLAINANNTSAVNKARQAVGLEPLSGLDKAKSVLKDKQGQVADVKINDQDYSVGFEAMSPQGRTNLTPDEARKRGLTLGGVQEIEARGKIEGKSDGLLSKATDLIESIFSSDPKTDTARKASGDTGVTGYKGYSDEITRSPLPEIGTIRSPGGVMVGPAQVQAKKPEVSFSAREPYQVGGSVNPTTNTGGVVNPLGIGNAHSLNFYNPGQDNIDARLETALNWANVEIGNNQPLGITSGYRSPEHNKKVGGAPRSYHVSGDAADIDMSGMSEEQRMHLVHELGQRGAGGFITYSKSPNMLHVDMRPMEGGAPKFMHDRSSANMSKADGWFQRMAEDRGMLVPNNAPVPSVKPNDPIAESLDPIKATSSLDQLQRSSDNYAKGLVKESLAAPATDRFKDSLKDASPAKFASLGLTPRSDAQIEAIARTFAGELSPAQLEGIVAGDPVARTELAAMITTVENRAASKKYKSLDEALVPSQYNSLMDSKAAVTNSNFAKYKDSLVDTISTFYKGGLESPDYGATSYYNKDLVSPSWGDKMSSQSLIGDHTYGSLPEYGPNKAFAAERDRMAAAQVSDTRGFTPNLSPERDSMASMTYAGGQSTSLGRSPTSMANTSPSREGNNTGIGTSSPSSSQTYNSGATSSTGRNPTSVGGYSSSGTSTASGSSNTTSRSATVSGSPTNDGLGKSKTPGGGF